VSGRDVVRDERRYYFWRRALDFGIPAAAMVFCIYYIAVLGLGAWDNALLALPAFLLTYGVTRLIHRFPEAASTDVFDLPVSGEGDLEKAREEIEREELEAAVEMLLEDVQGDLSRAELAPAAAQASRSLTELFLLLGPPGGKRLDRSGASGGPVGGVDVGPGGRNG
jgi:hypothetical protein